MILPATQPQLGQEVAQPPAAIDAVGVERLQDCQDVLLDGEAAENRGLLRQIADALAGADIHRIVGHVRAVEEHAPGSGAVRPTPSRAWWSCRRRSGPAGPTSPEAISRLTPRTTVRP